MTDRLWVVLARDLTFLGFRMGAKRCGDPMSYPSGTDKSPSSGDQFDAIATGGISVYTKEVAYWVDTTWHPGIRAVNPYTGEEFELQGDEMVKMDEKALPP